jgi:hypothetical protein
MYSYPYVAGALVLILYIIIINEQLKTEIKFLFNISNTVWFIIRETGLKLNGS